MKVGAGANVTPPAGTPLGRVSQTTSASLHTPPPRLSKTPPPRLSKTPPPRLSMPAQRRVTTPTPMPPLAAQASAVQAPPPSSGKGKVMIVGVCMIAFSCGVMSTVAVDRFWPRPRAQCGGGQAVFAAGTTPTPDPEAILAPPVAPTPAPAEVTPLPAPEPKTPPVAVAPATRTAPPPAAVAPAVRTAPPAARPAAVSKSPARPTGRAAVAVRPAPAQGREALRKRAVAAQAAGDTMPPTESWVDPFN